MGSPGERDAFFFFTFTVRFTVARVAQWLLEYSDTGDKTIPRLKLLAAVVSSWLVSTLCALGHSYTHANNWRKVGAISLLTASTQASLGYFQCSPPPNGSPKRYSDTLRYAILGHYVMLDVRRCGGGHAVISILFPFITTTTATTTAATTSPTKLHHANPLETGLSRELSKEFKVLATMLSGSARCGLIETHSLNCL